MANVPGHRDLMPDEAGMPANYDVDDLNRYLQHWSREAQANWLLRVKVPAILIGVFTAYSLHQAAFTWPIVALGLVLSTLINYYFLKMDRAGATIRKGIFFLCPICNEELVIESTQPNSAWECPNCQSFSHFETWQRSGSRTITVLELFLAFACAGLIAGALQVSEFQWYWIVLGCIETVVVSYALICGVFAGWGMVRGSGPSGSSRQNPRANRRQNAGGYAGDIVANAYRANELGEQARRLTQQNRFDEAIALLDEAIQVRPGDPCLYSEKSGNQMKLGDLSAALQSMDRAIAIDGNNAMFHSNRAAILFKQGRFAESESSAKNALRCDSNYRSAHSIIAAIKNR